MLLAFQKIDIPSLSPNKKYNKVYLFEIEATQ